MNHIPEILNKRIQNIRKANRRSIHDCASLLDITKEQYLGFENGTAQLTLPDVELLARFFDVPLTAFFDESPLDNLTLSLPERSHRPQYKHLRHKMIRAKFNMLREKTGVTLEELHEKTGIPQKDLSDFDNISTPIPISNLIMIADCLGESLDYFLDENYQTIENQPDQDNQKTPKWQPEYPEIDKADDNREDDPYEQLVSALKIIPKEEQAQIAKILLQYIKTLQ